MNYNKVIIPEGRERKDYFPHERRAEMLKMLIAEGHPHSVTYRQFAALYNISIPQISKDLKEIRKELNQAFSKDAELVVNMVFNKVIKQGIKSASYKENFMAAQAAKAWYEWLQGIGAKANFNQPNITLNTMQIYKSPEEAIAKFIEQRKKGENGQPAIDVKHTES